MLSVPSSPIELLLRSKYFKPVLPKTSDHFFNDDELNLLLEMSRYFRVVFLLKPSPMVSQPYELMLQLLSYRVCNFLLFQSMSDI